MIDTLLQHPIVPALGWSLIHSLWVSTLIAMLVAGLIAIIPKISATWQYRISLSGLWTILLANLLIFIHYYTKHKQVSLPALTTEKGNLLAELFVGTQHSDYFQQALQQLENGFPILVLLWLTGTLISGFRLAGGWWQLRTLSKKGIKTPEQEWTARLNDLCTQMGIRRQVRLFWSDRVQGPVTLRHFRPVILIPAGLLTQLSPAQLEVILLHELAHIRRLDYLVNCLQSLLEVLFFYHPAVWWLSGQVRTAREHCCDDLVLQKNQEHRMLYAQTLTLLSAYSLQSKTKLLMSYTGNKNTLTYRVKRLFGQQETTDYSQKPLLSGLLVLSFILLALAQTNYSFATPQTTTVSPIPETVLKPIATDTIKPTPLFFLNDKEVDKAVVDALNPDDIATIDVRKADKAIEKYGERAKNGVITIYTKSYTEKVRVNPEHPPLEIKVTPAEKEQPLYVLDGEKLARNTESIRHLDPDDIESINVLKGEKAIKKYGEDGRFGVVEITTKQQ